MECIRQAIHEIEQGNWQKGIRTLSTVIFGIGIGIAIGIRQIKKPIPIPRTCNP